MSEPEVQRSPDGGSNGRKPPGRGGDDLHPPVPSPSADGDGRDIAQLLLPLFGWLARKGLDPSSPERFLKSCARVGRYEGVAGAFGGSDRERLLREIWNAVRRRVANFEKPQEAHASRAARAVVAARSEAADASAAIPTLEQRERELLTRRDHLRAEVDAAAATLPDPPVPLPPTEQELIDEQADAEPVYSPSLISKLPQRIIEMALDLVTFYPLLAGAALGSELLGITGSRLLVLVMALAASLAVPLGACRLGEMTVEGSLRDRRRALLAWGGFAVLLCVPLVTGGARALQVLGRDYGTAAGAVGVFALAMTMCGIVLLEFAQGRRAAKGVLVMHRRRVAAEQRARRRNPPPPPEPKELVAKRARLSETENELSACRRELGAERSRLAAASKTEAAARLELKRIRTELERMVRAEDALGREAANQALRIRSTWLRRMSGREVVEIPTDELLLELLPMPSVFDPEALVPVATSGRA